MISPIFVPFSDPNCKLSLNIRGVTRHFWKRFVAINFDPDNTAPRAIRGDIPSNSLQHIRGISSDNIRPISFIFRNSEVSWRAWILISDAHCLLAYPNCVWVEMHREFRSSNADIHDVIFYTILSWSRRMTINQLCRILLCKTNATIIPLYDLPVTTVMYDNDLVAYASTSMYRHLTMSKHHFH